MNKKAYIAPAVEIVNIQGEAVMAAASLTASDGVSTIIDFDGNASDHGITSADAKVNSLWGEDEE